MILNANNLNQQLNIETLFKKNSSIALVGSGGKTTWMEYIIDKYKNNYKIIATTTTQIIKPNKYVDLTQNNDSYKKHINMYPYLYIGSEVDNNKISSPDIDNINWARQNCEFFIYEADGSRRLPLKYPKDTEPVILENTDNILVVVGISCIDKLISEYMYNYEDFLNVSNYNKTDIINEEIIAAIIKKGFIDNKKLKCNNLIIIINQADTLELIKRAVKIYNILDTINNKKITKLISSFKKGDYNV